MLQQGNSMTADYAFTIHTLAVQTGQSKLPLKIIYHMGLSLSPPHFKQFIQLSKWWKSNLNCPMTFSNHYTCPSTPGPISASTSRKTYYDLKVTPSSLWLLTIILSNAHHLIPLSKLCTALEKVEALCVLVSWTLRGHSNGQRTAVHLPDIEVLLWFD